MVRTTKVTTSSTEAPYWRTTALDNKGSRAPSTPQKNGFIWTNWQVPIQILIGPECQLQWTEMALVADVSLCLAWQSLLDTQKAPIKVLRNREQCSNSISWLRKLMVPTTSAELPSNLGPPLLHRFNRIGPTLNQNGGNKRIWPNPEQKWVLKYLFRFYVVKCNTFSFAHSGICVIHRKAFPRMRKICLLLFPLITYCSFYTFIFLFLWSLQHDINFQLF